MVLLWPMLAHSATSVCAELLAKLPPNARYLSQFFNRGGQGTAFRLYFEGDLVQDPIMQGLPGIYVAIDRLPDPLGAEQTGINFISSSEAYSITQNHLDQGIPLFLGAPDLETFDGVVIPQSSAIHRRVMDLTLDKRMTTFPMLILTEKAAGARVVHEGTHVIQRTQDKSRFQEFRGFLAELQNRGALSASDRSSLELFPTELEAYQRERETLLTLPPGPIRLSGLANLTGREQLQQLFQTHEMLARLLPNSALVQFLEANRQRFSRLEELSKQINHALDSSRDGNGNGWVPHSLYEEFKVLEIELAMGLHAATARSALMGLSVREPQLSQQVAHKIRGLVSSSSYPRLDPQALFPELFADRSK